MSYISIKNEIEMTEINRRILEDKKTLLFPVIEGEYIKAIKTDSLKKLEEKKFGVIEPVCEEESEKADIDLIIVPGVAFDLCTKVMKASLFDSMNISIFSWTQPISFFE